MKDYGLRFHHLGLAVRQPEPALRFLKGLGYEIGEPVFDSRQNVNLVMCAHETMPDVEVICPAQGESPIDGILQRHDAMIYHSCFVTENLEVSLDAMTQAGHRLFCVSPPTEAVLFRGRRVSFHRVRGFGTIEIIEAPGREPPE